MKFWKRFVRHPELTKTATHVALGTLLALASAAFEHRKDKKRRDELTVYTNAK